MSSIEKKIADQVWAAAPENAVDECFREALCSTAADICHETGTGEDDFIKFCADTVREWVRAQVRHMPRS